MALPPIMMYRTPVCILENKNIPLPNFVEIQYIH